MNMKFKVLATVFASGLVVSATSFADGMSDVNPYIGADLTFNMPKYKQLTGIDIKRNKLGFGFNAGARICDYFGIEAGYGQILKAKDKTNTAISGKINNFYVDALGYFAASPEVDLIGSIGIGRLKQKVTGLALSDAQKKAKFGYRLGVGVQYKFDENLAARVRLVHQKGNKEFLKSLNLISLGIAYTF